jgi:23S rRNA pseudouridine2605 synthase
MKLIQALPLLINCSRREAEALTRQNSIKVNGQIVSQYSFEVDPEHDLIEVENQKIKQNNLKQKHYFIYYKPKGLEVSLKCKTHSLNEIILHIGIPNLKPVGRLDMDSEGLLLLTDDGDLIYQLTHPKHHIPKIYKVWVKGLKTEEQVRSLKKSLQIKSVNFQEEILEVELQEGQNRQIRRNCAQAGLFVERILRTKLGAVQLGKLKVGQWKPLKSSLIAKLLR